MRPGPALVVTLVFAVLSLAAAASVPDFSGLAYQQRLGGQIPMAAVLRDEAGRDVTLAELARDRPLVLALGYFRCPNLCGVVRADLLDGLKRSGMQAGRDYALIVLSVDPSETSADARGAKAGDLQLYPAPGAAENWHFLTGTETATGAVAGAVGFHDRFDPDLKQLVHPTGIVFATPAGIVSGYLLGVGYRAEDVRLAVTRASWGAIAAKALPVLLFCYHYDPVTGRYTLAIMTVLRLVAGLTALVLGGSLFLAFRREGRRP
jgi:protein SCO1